MRRKGWRCESLRVTRCAAAFPHRAVSLHLSRLTSVLGPSQRGYPANCFFRRAPSRSAHLGGSKGSVTGGRGEQSVGGALHITVAICQPCLHSQGAPLLIGGATTSPTASHTTTRAEFLGSRSFRFAFRPSTSLPQSCIVICRLDAWLLYLRRPPIPGDRPWNPNWEKASSTRGPSTSLAPTLSSTDELELDGRPTLDLDLK